MTMRSVLILEASWLRCADGGVSGGGGLRSEAIEIRNALAVLSVSRCADLEGWKFFERERTRSCEYQLTYEAYSLEYEGVRFDSAYASL